MCTKTNTLNKSKAGFTLVEIMIAVVILLVAVVGASGYRYYAALDARKARMHITAARIGLLLCESWRGLKGSETYDPVVHLVSDLKISESTTFSFSTTDPVTSSAAADGFNLLGAYEIVSDDEGLTYYAILSWKDAGTDLKLLNVIIAWPHINPEGISASEAYKLFKLTTYAET